MKSSRYFLRSLLLMCFSYYAQSQQIFQYQKVEIPVVQHVELKKYLKNFEVYAISTSSIHEHVKMKTEVELNLYMADHRWQIYLTPNDLRSKQYQSFITSNNQLQELELEEVFTYKGYTNNNFENEVRMNIRNDMINGFIKEGNTHYFIEPLKNFIPDTEPSGYVIYKPEDVIFRKNFTCAAVEVVAYKNKTDNYRSEGENCLQVEIATEADYEYYQTYGDDSNNQILGILNQVEGVYNSTFELTFVITYQHVYASSDDPYVSTDGETLLSEFTNYWNANHQDINRDIAHLWTGKELDGTTIGYAWIGIVCNNSGLSYGLSQNWDQGQFGKVGLTAHEIGHNFGGLHVDGVDNFNDCNSEGPIMCSSIQVNALYFWETNITRINNHLNAFDNCLCVDCPVSLVLSDPLLSVNESFDAVDHITATNLIANNANISYRAGLYVALNPGFEVELSSVFIGEIQSCVGGGDNIVEGGGSTGNGYEIISNIRVYPNPFNQSATLEYNVPEENTFVSIGIYNRDGQQVDELLFREKHNRGIYRVQVDGRTLPSGMYIYRVQIGDKTEYGKMVLRH